MKQTISLTALTLCLACGNGYAATEWADCVSCTSPTDSTKCASYGVSCCAPCQIKAPDPITECNNCTGRGGRCMYKGSDCCEPCYKDCEDTDCISSHESLGNGCSKSTNRGCVNNQCATTSVTLECDSGYYGIPLIQSPESTECYGCTPCPGGGLSMAGTQSKTGCYVLNIDRDFSDETGSGKYEDGKCYYGS